MSAAAAQAAEPGDAAPPPKKGKKKLIIILAAVLLLALAGGGGAVYVMKKRAAAAAAAAEEEGGEAGAHKAKDGHRAAPTFVPLDPFVVNLADKDAERYAQIGITLELDEPKFADEIKAYMPAIRNAILMILAHKSSHELLERSGKEALAAEIMREAVRPMGIEIDADEAAPAPGAKHGEAAEAAQPAKKPKKKTEVHNPVQRVHFASFIVQ